MIWRDTLVLFHHTSKHILWRGACSWYTFIRDTIVDNFMDLCTHMRPYNLMTIYIYLRTWVFIQHTQRLQQHVQQGARTFFERLSCETCFLYTPSEWGSLCCLCLLYSSCRRPPEPGNSMRRGWICWREICVASAHLLSEPLTLLEISLFRCWIRVS